MSSIATWMAPLLAGALVACGGSSPAGSVPDRCAGVSCPAPDQCHEAGTCDPASGTCSAPAKADGTACDDGIACTSTDVCSAGVCVGAPLGAPTGLVEQPASTNEIALVWDPVDGAAGYAVRRDGALASPAEAVTMAAYTDRGLGDGEAHDYTVAAVDCRGRTSPESAPLTASTQTAAPQVTVTPKPDRISLAWTLPAGALTFELQRSTPTCEDALETLPAGSGLTAADDPFDDLTAEVGTAYCYVVVSINQGGRRPSSVAGPEERVGPPTPPTNLVGVPGNRRVDLYWNPVISPFVAGYRVYRDGVALTPDTGPSATTFADVDAELMNGVLYTYWVRTVDTGGQLSAYASVTVTPSPTLAWPAPRR